MIDLYSVPTANGQKVQIMLEEAEIAFTPHLVDLYAGVHRQEPFLKMNRFGRVPVIVDRDAGDIAIGETLAILIYLAEKSGRFLPKQGSARTEVFQWLSAIAANIGPLFRGIYKFTTLPSGRNEAAISYFRGEAENAFAMLDRALAGREWLVGEAYTLADISAYPVAINAKTHLPRGLDPYPNIQDWANRIGARAAVQRGMKLFTTAAMPIAPHHATKGDSA